MLGVIQRYADEDKAAAEKKAKEVIFYCLAFCRRPPLSTANLEGVILPLACVDYDTPCLHAVTLLTTPPQ